ncbi:MAG: diaminopimelate decarboxylase [Nitriliruptorales bacterium]|nr:diaminopimelate decarboxylase [Nitriliruptorales bacterium]
MAIWPATTARDDDGVLHIGGVPVTDLAEEFGTPLWVVDEEDLRARCRAWRAAFPDADVAYASKAWPVVGILQIVTQEGLWVDVASAGELHTALVAAVPPERIVFHGNNKSVEELHMAAEAGVGRVVVDSFEELDRLAALGRAMQRTIDILLRVTPGIEAHTHEYVRTGHDDSKFGFTMSTGLADQAYDRARDLEHVNVLGVHAHIGSQVFDTEPFEAAAEALVGLLGRWRDRHGTTLAECNLGGGMGIAYGRDDDPPALDELAARVGDAIDRACDAIDLPRPRLALEPGRAIVGPTTVTLYRVGTVKRLPGLTTWVSVDGGMSDNIRPALYDATHEVALANRPGAVDGQAVTVVGKHCESGDVLAADVELPTDLRAGDLLAFASTGAYNAAMASNYNRLPRPAAVLVVDGQSRTLVRRETLDDLVARDVPLA